MRAAILLAAVVSLLSLPALAEEDPSVPFIDQTLARSEEFYGSGMKSLVEDVIKISGLTDPKRSADLRAAAEAAVRDKMDKSKTGLWRTWREMNRDGQVDQTSFWIAYKKLPEAILTPDRSPLWTEALTRCLQGSELTLWTAEETQRRARIEKAIADYIGKARDQWKTTRVDARKALAEELIVEQKLDAPAAQKLRDGVPATIDQAVPSWGKSLEKATREYVKSAFLGGAEDRIQQIENGQLNFGITSEPDAIAAEDAAWSALLKGVLPAAAYAEFTAREQQRLERRSKAMAMMAVAELDRQLRLTDSQRAQMETTFLRIVRDNKPKFDAMLAQNYSNSGFLLMVCSGVKEDELKQLIEPDQIAVWREVAGNYSGWWNQF